MMAKSCNLPYRGVISRQKKCERVSGRNSVEKLDEWCEILKSVLLSRISSRRWRWVSSPRGKFCGRGSGKGGKEGEAGSQQTARDAFKDSFEGCVA